MISKLSGRQRALGILLLAILVVGILWYFVHTPGLDVEVQFNAHPGDVDGAIFTPDSQRLMTTSGGETCVWNASTGNKITTFQSGAGHVQAMAVSSQGKFWACTRGRYISKKQWQFTLEIWNIATGTCVSLDLPQGRMDLPQANAIAVSPDESTVAVPLPNSQIGFFSASSASLISTLQRPVAPIVISYSPDGKFLASAEGNAVQVLSVATGQSAHTLTKAGIIGISGLHFWPGGNTLSTVVSFTSHDAVCVWDVPNSTLVREIDSDGGLGQPTFSADGQTLATYSELLSLVVGARSRIDIFNLTSGRRTFSVGGSVPFVCALAISPDAMHLASGHYRTMPTNGPGVVQIYSVK